MKIEQIGAYFRAFFDDGTALTVAGKDYGNDIEAFRKHLEIKQVKSFDGVKTFEIEGVKIAKSESGRTVLSGYANTKGKPDSYGDIPTNYNGQPIYQMTRFKKNPVMLVDHSNSVSKIMGRFTQVFEDERGLYFESELMKQEEAMCDVVKHAISAYENGFARALSIGGRWVYGDSKNPNHLTEALIVEISGVAIPADEDALCNPGLKPKQ
jgi:phage head maturation protease